MLRNAESHGQVLPFVAKRMIQRESIWIEQPLPARRLHELDPRISLMARLTLRVTDYAKQTISILKVQDSYSAISPRSYLYGLDQVAWAHLTNGQNLEDIQERGLGIVAMCKSYGPPLYIGSVGDFETVLAVNQRGLVRASHASVAVLNSGVVAIKDYENGTEVLANWSDAYRNRDPRRIVDIFSDQAGA